MPLILILAFFFSAACTVKKSTASLKDPGITGDSTTGDATNISVQRNIWSRGPIQAANPDNPALTAGDSLNSLPRQAVTLYDLASSSGGLSGPRLKVFYSESGDGGGGRSSPSLATFNATRSIAWDSKEFKSFMVYAHGSRAMRYMKELFPDLKYKIRSLYLTPLEVYSAVPDSPLNTRYRVNSSGKPGNVMFYQDPDADEPFNPADESDAIYHEFGHVLQHILNPEVLETFGNYDIDALLEALADFNAASILKDDKILLYLKSNAPHVFSSNNRNGKQHDRSLGGTLHFPDDYVGDYHLDGRIISNALNDLRKYLQGMDVTLLQDFTGSATIKWTGAATYFAKFTSDEQKITLRNTAFNTANYLALQALREIVPASSLIHYSERLIANVTSEPWAEQCGSNAACKTQVINAAKSILKSRGIFTSKPIRCTGDTCTPFTTSGTNPELALNDTGGLYYSALGSVGTEGKLDPCEAVLLIPNIKLRSGLAASAYDTLFEHIQLTGFTNYNSIDSVESNSPDYSLEDPEIKLWGFLLNGEIIYNLVGLGTGRYYTSHQSAVLSPAYNTFTSAKPSPLGWSVRAPSSGRATVKYVFSTRPFEVRYVEEAIYTNKTLTQNLTVTGTSNMCN